MPLTVLVKVPGGSTADLTNQDGLAGIGALEKSIAALPDVQTVRSLVDPMGEGKMSDLLRPSVQLSADRRRLPQAAQLRHQRPAERREPGRDPSADAYVGGLARCVPGPAPARRWIAAAADLATLHDGPRRRPQAGPRRRTSSTPSPRSSRRRVRGGLVRPGGAGGPARRAEGLPRRARRGRAGGHVASRPTSRAVGAVAALATNRRTRSPRCSCSARSRTCRRWFEAQPTPIYFAPTSVTPDADHGRRAAGHGRRPTPAARRARRRWPPPSAPTVLYAPPSPRERLRVDGRRRDPAVRHDLPPTRTTPGRSRRCGPCGRC